MPYTIRLSSGSVLTTIADQKIDDTTLPVALVGRGALNYGTDFAENFVYLLENFANVTPPANPLLGTIWFDRSQNRMKFYTGVWKPFDGDATPLNQPLTVVQRDANGSFAATAVTADLHGTADKALKLSSARQISLAGDASGSAYFDGSGNIQIATTVAHATMADKWSSARTISLVGPVSGSATIDGTGNVQLITALGAQLSVDISGNAGTSSKWNHAMTLQVAGDVSGATQFDGSATAQLNLTLPATGVQPGTYNTVTVDAKGRVLSAANVQYSTSGGSASYADNAGHAANADNATNAAHATNADNANHAANADNANYATTAGNSDKANNALAADFATVAGALQYSRGITLTGDVTGSATFDGRADITINTHIAVSTGGGGSVDTSSLDQRYVLKSGDSMSGQLYTPTLVAHDLQCYDGNFAMNFSSGQPTLVAGNGFYQQFDRSSAIFNFVAGGQLGMKLLYGGNLFASGQIYSFGSQAISDIALKSNVTPLANALQVIDSLNGYTYDKLNPETGAIQAEVGVIAQEVEAVIPQAVSETPDGYKTVSYDQLIPYLIESVKTLTARVEDLEKQLAAK